MNLLRKLKISKLVNIPPILNNEEKIYHTLIEYFKDNELFKFTYDSNQTFCYYIKKEKLIGGYIETLPINTNEYLYFIKNIEMYNIIKEYLYKKYGDYIYVGYYDTKSEKDINYFLKDLLYFLKILKLMPEKIFKMEFINIPDIEENLVIEKLYMESKINI